MVCDNRRGVQVGRPVLVAYFSYTHSSRMCMATRGLWAVSGGVGGGQAAPEGPLALVAGVGEQNRFALLSPRHRGPCFGRMVATSPCTPFTDVCAIRNAPAPLSLLRHTRVSTPGGSQTTCCARAGVQVQFPEKTMVGDTRRGGEQGTNAHECTCISTSLARQARMLAPPIPPDRSLRTHTREKEKNGGCIVPNGTDRDDATDSSKSGAKEGVDGRHPGPNASRMRPREGTLQPRLAPEAGGWVAGPMQPNHRARGRRR